MCEHKSKYQLIKSGGLFGTTILGLYCPDCGDIKPMPKEQREYR